MNMNISVIVQDFSMKFSMHVLRVLLEGAMSQIFDLCLSFYFMSKKGNFLLFFKTFFSRLHKIKTRAYIKNLRHGSLNMRSIIMYSKCQELTWNIY